MLKKITGCFFKLAILLIVVGALAALGLMKLWEWAFPGEEMPVPVPVQQVIEKIEDSPAAEAVQEAVPAVKSAAQEAVPAAKTALEKTRSRAEQVKNEMLAARSRRAEAKAAQKTCSRKIEELNEKIRMLGDGASERVADLREELASAKRELENWKTAESQAAEKFKELDAEAKKLREEAPLK